MRVSFFHYLHQSLGSRVQAREFAAAFRARGHEIFLHEMEWKDSVTCPLGTWYQGDRYGLHRYLYEAGSLLKNIPAYYREREIIQKEQPDIVLTRYKLYRHSSSWAARGQNLPWVLWMHASEVAEQKIYGRNYFALPGLARTLEENLVRSADRTMIVSDEIRRFLPSKIAQNGRVSVIPNGVDPEKFKPQAEGREIRRSFPGEDPLVIGFVGNFLPWHGIQGLLSLMACGFEISPRVCFLLLGKGPRLPEIETEIRSKGWDARRIRLAGQVAHESVPQYLQAMDLCLLPYDQKENEFYFSPLKLFEAMAAGKPVLARNLGQMGEVVQDGVQGFLYQEAGSDGCVQLKKLIADASLRVRMGAEARLRVLEKFTWAHTARAVEGVLEEDLKEKKRK